MIEKAQAGDERSFEGLFFIYRKRIFVFLYRMMGNESTAEELMQVTFVKAYTSIKNYKPTGSFSSWLYGIARNVAKTEIRNIVREKAVSIETRIGEEEQMTLADTLKSETKQPDEEMLEVEADPDIQRALDMMPEHYREILTLCLIQKVPYVDAAKILNTNAGTVASRLYQAKRRFIEIYEKLKKGNDEMSA